MSGKKINKRIGHKKARQADRESLRGRLPDTVRGMHYSSKLPQPSLPDSAVTGGPSKTKKNKSKWCKGHVGKEHNYIWRRSDNWWRSGWRCERCTKRHWGTPKGKERETVINQRLPDHWDYYNITLRLAGKDCQCYMCTKETSRD